MSLKNIGNYFSALGTSAKSIPNEIKGLSDIINGSSSTIFGNLSSLFGGITDKSKLPILTNALATISNSMESFTGTDAQIKGIAAALKGLSDETIASTLSLFNFSEAQLVNILKATEMDEALAKTTAAQIASAAASKTASVGFSALGTSIKAIGTSIKAVGKGLIAFLTTPAGMIMAAVASLVLLYKALDYVNKAQDRAIEKANESRQAYKEAQDEVNSVSKELETVQKRMQELESMGALSLTEKAELQSLKAQNEELNNTYKIKKAIANLAQKAASGDAKKALTKKKNYDTVAQYKDLPEGSTISGFKYINEYGNVIEQSRRYIDSLSEMKKRKNKMLEEQSKIDPNNSKFDKKKFDKYTKGIEVLDNQIKTIESSLYNSITVVQENYESLLDVDGNPLEGYEDIVISAKAVLNDFVSDTDKAAEKVKKINGLLSKKDFAKHKDKLIEAAKSQDDADFTKTIKGISGLENALSDAGISTEEFKEQLVSLGSEDSVNFENTKKNLKTIKDAIKSNTELSKQSQIDTFFSDKSYNDIDKFYSYIQKKNIDISEWNLDDLTTNWNIVINGNAVKAVSELKNSLKDSITLAENLSTVISESASGKTLSTDKLDEIRKSLGSLKEYDASALFEKTAYGVHLNREELDKLTKSYEASQKADYQRTVNDLTQKYVEAAEKLDNLKDTDEGYQEQLATAEGLKEQLEQARLLQSQFDGLTSAYNKFVEATSASDERESYANIGDSYEEMKKLVSNGWYGDKGLNAYLDLLLSDTERTGNAIKDFNKLTAKIKGTNFSIMDFFQYNEDGDLTSVGLYNFLDAVKQVMGKTASEYVKINKDGSSTFDFTGDKVSEVAEKLGMSEEAVHRLTQAMIDAGWDVKMDDASDSAETLSQKLEKAQSAVEKTSGGKEIVDSYKVDVDTKNYDEEIAKANSYIKEINNGDLDTESQKAALDYVNAELDLLIQKKLALSQPTFMNLNVSDVAVGAQDILKSLQDYQRAVNEVNSLKLKGVNTDSDEYKKAEEKVKSLAEQVLKLSKESGIDIGVDVNSDNYKTFAEKVEKDEIVIPLAGDASEVEDSLAKSIKNALDGVELSFDFLGKEHTINIKANVEGQEQVDNFNASKDKAGRNSSATVSATVQGKEAIDSFNVSKDKADEDASTTLTADTSDASSKFASILEKIRAIANNWFIKMSYSTNKGEKGVAGANGTAITGSFANGTAFLKGNWGTKDSGTALGGELGQELVVRGSRFFTIGDESAEFFKYQKGDIIFNADQTREILAKGKIRNASRRGKAYLEGTAFAYTGSSSYGKPNIPGGTKSSASKSSSSSKRKSSSSSSNSKDTKETFDWVETAITRIEEAIDRLDVKASSTYRSWSERNSNLKSQISQTRKEIDLQQQAYNRYIQEANKVGLNSKYRSMIQNGSMNISTIKDEKLIEKIKEYQDWYEKAIKCKDAIDELKESVSKLYETAFENVSKEYEGYLAVIEHEKNILEEYISQSEAKGRITSVKYYEALIDTEQDNIAQLQKERNALVSAMNNAVNSGAITKGSEAWYEMVKSIDDVTMSIEEANTALLEYQNNIRETKWESFDLLQDNISQITSEADFLIDLLSNDKLVDDTGKLSNSGMASVGLHGVNYNTYMAQADKYAKEMKKINTELAKDPANKDLLERRNELLESQRDAISSAEDEKQAIKDLVEDGIEKELDSLQELIDKYNEALDSQKDLYDYQKNVKEQTKEIASLQKQLDAYANDTSEETKAKIQQLTVSLEDARAELEETEYDKYISDQKDILDNLYTEYEDLLNSRLDNLDYLIEDMIANINDNATSIRDTILEKSDDVGYTLTDSMSSIWDSNIETITSVVTTYNDHFSESLTSVNAVLNSIDSNLNSIINKNNAEAANKAKNASTSSASSNKPSSNTKPVSNNKTTNNSKSSGNFFKYKKDSYPKSKLDKEKSIVDRLKYFNFDSSFSARKSYYSSMGLGSNYTGSASQNTSMIRWMKTHGYSQGGFIGELQRIGKINGDDSVTVNTFKKGEAILTPAQAQSFESFVKQLTKAENIVDISEHLNRLGKLGGTNTSVDVGGININIPIERVEDYNDFISQLKTDRNFERLIQSMSVDLLAGKSSLRKYR